MRLTALINFLVFISARSATSDCSCGYTINTTTQALFTEILETDFLHYNQTWNPITGLPEYGGSTSKNWVLQAYNVTPGGANPYGKEAEYRNVVANPIESEYDWGGEGKGLELWVRRESDGMVPMSEILSQRDDVLYGSFRVGMKMTDVMGTVGAFFFYLNDSTEIDIEILSKEDLNKTINLVIQSPQSAKQGYASGPDFIKQSVDLFPASGYNEYRFDWLPDRVDFYANSQLLTTVTQNVPRTAGKLHMSHWSNGNRGWSAGPPEQDAVMVVSYVKAYFNTSSERGSLACVGAAKKVCAVPDQTVPPEISGPNGNVTGKTFFFGSGNETSAVINDSEDGPKTSDGIRQSQDFVMSCILSLLCIILIQSM
ncbi:Beta-glucanase [Pseudocercospora fuligena]|uniref:Beta-glucanase n=1 Tax=Pseudocercospora fuligena TaxID=685502 RepID=A0A8H6R6C8_9PEZI|nr:Beta-glucanase [Pseudocercospora fuligena]